MLKFTLFFLLSAISLSAFAQLAPWAKTNARIYVLTTDRSLDARNGTYQSAWKELEEQLAAVTGRRPTKLSLEYVLAHEGAMILSATQYADTFDGFPEHDSEIQELWEKEKNVGLTVNDFEGPRWLHLIKPIDDEEEKCLWIGKVDGRWTGCEDAWAGGLSADKVVCIGKKTYLRCQVDCIKKIYNRQNEIKTRPGFCPETRP